MLRAMREVDNGVPVSVVPGLPRGRAHAARAASAPVCSVTAAQATSSQAARRALGHGLHVRLDDGRPSLPNPDPYRRFYASRPNVIIERSIGGGAFSRRGRKRLRLPKKPSRSTMARNSSQPHSTLIESFNGRPRDECLKYGSSQLPPARMTKRVRPSPRTAGSSSASNRSLRTIAR
jgi:hypothetical protein